MDWANGWGWGVCCDENTIGADGKRALSRPDHHFPFPLPPPQSHYFWAQTIDSEAKTRKMKEEGRRRNGRSKSGGRRRGNPGWPGASSLPPPLRPFHSLLSFILAMALCFGINRFHLCALLTWQFAIFFASQMIFPVLFLLVSKFLLSDHLQSLIHF